MSDDLLGYRALGGLIGLVITIVGTTLLLRWEMRKLRRKRRGDL